MNAILKKLRFKDQEPVLVLNCPEELEGMAGEIRGTLHRDPVAGSHYPFVIAFARSLVEATRVAERVKSLLAADAVFWLAYPKKTSKRYRGVDINRDSGYAAVEPLGFRFVAMAALDDDWGAMRFKEAEG